MSLFSRQCHNLCLLSLAFIIDWRVVINNNGLAGLSKSRNSSYYSQSFLFHSPFIQNMQSCSCFTFFSGFEKEFPQFTTVLFFNVLLPPIILDASYAIYDRSFLQNLGSVLIYAVIGTLFNVFLIGK